MIRRNVLIFHSGALGDFVLSWPLALALGRLHPQSRIIYVAPASKGKLAERVLRTESVDAEPGWHHLYADAAGLPETCRKLLGGAHSIYAFLGTTGAGATGAGAAASAAKDPHSTGAVATAAPIGDGVPPPDAWTKNVAAIVPEAQLVHLRPRPPEKYAAHAVDFLLDELNRVPAVKTAVGQILASIGDVGLRINRAPGRDIIVHPGSGGREKCWPVENYLALITRLQAAGQSVRVVLGEVEMERLPDAVIRQFNSAAATVNPATYLELLAEISTAAAFVGNDSGPAHLAGIVGVPTLTLFGPTDPIRWRPLGPTVRTLHAKSLAALGVDEVYNLIQEMFS